MSSWLTTTVIGMSLTRLRESSGGDVEANLVSSDESEDESEEDDDDSD